MNRFWASRVTGATRSLGSTSQPRRQPVMQKYFEKLLTTIASRQNARMVSAGSS